MRVKRMLPFIAIFFKDYRAITLYPFGIYSRVDKLNVFEINHETIHWQQQKEMLGLFFYLWYIIEWFLKLFKYGRDSYYNISFEREAFANHFDMDYDRKMFAWFKYL